MPEPKKYPPQDCQGQKIKKGDIVLVKELPKLSAKKGDEFEVVRVAFNHILDTSNEVLGFDEFGHVELSFEISKGKFPGQHTVWIEPFFLQVNSSPAAAKAKPTKSKPVAAKAAKKVATKKAAAKKGDVKKNPAKKPTASKAVAKPAAVKKVVDKKVAAKKVVAKKAVTPKAPKKAATKTKAVTKKIAMKKPVAKKPVAKKAKVKARR